MVWTHKGIYLWRGRPLPRTINLNFMVFLPQDINLGRERANVFFSSFLEEFFLDFNSTLWQGRNYKNMQFALYAYNHKYVLDNNFYVDFPLNPEYVKEQ